MRPELGHGIFSFANASRLTLVKPAQVREWFLPRISQRGGVFLGDYELDDGPRILSFLDLIDLLVAGKLCSDGIRMKQVRKIYKEMEQNLGVHPFSRKRLFTDGKRVFFSDRELGKRHLVEIPSMQEVFPKVVLPYLKDVIYDQSTSLAERWNITKNVIIDPQRQLGKPIIRSSGHPTRILAQAYWANDRDAKIVAEWYGVPPSHVADAVTFESRFGAAA